MPHLSRIPIIYSFVLQDRRYSHLPPNESLMGLLAGMKNLECIDRVVSPRYNYSSDLDEKAVELAKQVLRRVASESGAEQYAILKSLDGIVRRYSVYTFFALYPDNPL
jgi:hypothetical protein